MVLLGGSAGAAALALPWTFDGVEAFLRRTMANHFGADALDIEGVGDFIHAYAAASGDEESGRVKRIAAKYYFAMRGDRIFPIGAAKAFEERFLNAVLIRSNIIAIRQGRADAFDYADPDPWAPVCGLYLSALAEEAET